jgi:hypothetical protein
VVSRAGKKPCPLRSNSEENITLNKEYDLGGKGQQIHLLKSKKGKMNLSQMYSPDKTALKNNCSPVLPKYEIDNKIDETETVLY